MSIFWYGCVIVFLMILLISLLYYIKHHRGKTAATIAQQKVVAATTAAWPLTINVGILAPLASESCDHLTEGLTKLLSLSSRTRYNIIPFLGDNTRVTLFSNAQQAAKVCDILITVGVTSANIAAEARETLAAMPIIKACLREKQLNKLLPHSPSTMVIVTAYDYYSQVALFKKLKPKAGLICIAYRQHNDTLRSEVAALKEALTDAGFKTDVQVLAHNAHIDNQLSAFHQTYDTLFIMPHTVTAANIQELVTYCANKKITLCTQEFDVVTLGAALGFGGYEKKLGSDIGHIIRNIFEGKKSYQSQPLITHNPSYQLMINKQKCTAQGLEIDLDYLTILEQVRLFSTTPLINSIRSNNHDTINQDI